MLSKYFYPHIGGVEKHVEKICGILLKNGHKVTVVTENFDNKQKINEINSSGVKIERFSYPKVKILGIIFLWINIFKYRDIIKKADVIHCHDVFIWYLPFRFLFPFKHVYTTFHGYEGYPIKKSAIIIRKISELLSNGNICVGDFIRKWYGTKPSIVTYGATDLIKARESKHFKYDAIFVGRLDEQTNIIEYLSVVKRLTDKLNKFELLVLGDGKYLKEARDIADCKGFVKDPEKYYSEAKYAFVSRYLSILEAFISRKLVFAIYDNEVKEDYLKMAPYAKWIVIEKSSEQLTERLLYFGTHQMEADKMIENAYTWARNQTWNNMVNNYIKLWGLKT